MSSIYLGGHGKLGLSVSLHTFPLCAPVVASSGAALTALALQLGGADAVKLLASKAFVKLLKGFGSSKERKTLAKSWLARLGIPLDAGVVDLESLGCTPCGFVLYCAERQTPMLFHGRCAEESLGLVELVAALCSLMPVRTGAVSLLDAEHILPFECLAAAVSPPPLFVVGPSEPSLGGHRGVAYSALFMSFSERMLTRNACSLPIFRVHVPHLLETLVSSAVDCDFVRRDDAAAAFLCFSVACILQTLKQRSPPGQDIPRPRFQGAPRPSS
jgi:hypothetical protein